MLSIRTLVRRPTLTVAALVTLAIGIGANTAVFSVVNAVLLRPLPYRDPDALVALWPQHYFSNAELLVMQANARVLESVATFSPGWGMALIGDGEAQQLNAARTSTNFFATIGVAPALGRAFLPEESRPGNDRVVILSDGLWRTRYGADRGILGRTIVLDGQPNEVIGVMPPGFEFVARTDLWAPLIIDPTAWFHRGGTAVGLARLRPGATLEQAHAELRSMIPAMQSELAASTEYGRDARVIGLREMIVGPVRGTFLVLLGAVGFIVLIAAANVGNLLLVRAAERRREIAVRTALGATRRHIVRLVLGESLTLSLGGTIAGLALGAAMLPVLRASLPATLPRIGEISLDLTVLVICATVSLTTAVLFAIAPTLLATHVDPQSALGSARGADAGGRIGHKARAALVTAEVALAVVLVAGAGLMVQTLWRLTRVDPGFRSDRVVTLRLQPVTTRLDTPDKIRQYFRDVEGRLAGLPGTSAVGAIHHLPLSGIGWFADLEIEDKPVTPSAPKPRVGWRLIDGEYFKTMGIPMIAGRAFDDRDRTGSNPVVIVSEVLARQHWPGESPVGRRLRAGNATRDGGAREPGWVTVVGVVGSVHHEALQQPAGPEIYRPIAQKSAGAMAIVMRTTADPTTILARVRETVRSIDADVPISDLRTLDDVISSSIARPRLVLWLLGLFAAVGLVLGAVGVYGVVAYAVSRRTHEIGIRMALGAGSHRIGRMVVGQGMRYALVGVTIGTIAALAVTRWMQTIVYDVRTTDPLTYATVAAIMLAVVSLASWIPARRAGRVQPVEALRGD
jgi:putative ABC transport system permease protein